MTEQTTDPIQTDQQQKEAPVSQPSSRNIFDTASIVFDTLATPFQQKQKAEEIRVLEDDLGINSNIDPSDHPSNPSSSSSSSSSSSDTNSEAKEEEKDLESSEDSDSDNSEDTKEDDGFDMAMAATSTKKKKSSSSSSSKQLTYKLGGMNMTFSNSSPNQNNAYNVGIVHPRVSRPDAGTSAETKLIQALSKNQYPKFSKSESSLKDVNRLDQARGIDDNIRQCAQVLEMYDIMQPFDIVYPKDPALKLVTLKVKGGSPVVKSLLNNFCNLSIKQIALSSSSYSAFGCFKDSAGAIQNFGRDLSWSLLHFKEHVDPVLHNDIELRLQSFKKEE